MLRMMMLIGFVSGLVLYFKGHAAMLEHRTR